MPCSEKSFSSRSITDSVTSPFQTKNGRVLNSAGGLGNSVLRRARESTVAVVATDTKISARTKLFLIEVSLSHAGKEGLLFGLTISLAEQTASSVGRSQESYFFGRHQWALAIDAAAPV